MGFIGCIHKVTVYKGEMAMPDAYANALTKRHQAISGLSSAIHGLQIEPLQNAG